MEEIYQSLRHLLIENVEETGKELGRGAFGVVYEVKYNEMICAGKKLHEIIVNFEKSAVQKFVDECLLHSQLRHPNIVQLMGVYRSPDVSQIPVLVMEYLPLSLANCLGSEFSLPEQTKYSILLDVAHALNFLHNQKTPIIHRDLSANNVLLTRSFVAKVTDLGLSKVLNSFTRSRGLTMVPGNAAVMPPEAHHFNPQYDTTLDVFSYGCLILHVFTHIWPAPKRQSDIVHLSEWERRAECTQKMGPNHPMYDIAKKCLADDYSLRCDMKTIIQFIKSIKWTPCEEKETDEALYDDILGILHKSRNVKQKEENEEEHEYDYPFIQPGHKNGLLELSQSQSKPLSSSSVNIRPQSSHDRNFKRPSSMEDWRNLKKDTCSLNGARYDNEYDYADVSVLQESPQSSLLPVKKLAANIQQEKTNCMKRSINKEQPLSSGSLWKKRPQSYKQQATMSLSIRISNDVSDELPTSFRPRYPGTPPATHRQSFPFNQSVSPVSMDMIPPPLPPRPNKPLTPMLCRKTATFSPSSPPIPRRELSLTQSMDSSFVVMEPLPKSSSRQLSPKPLPKPLSRSPNSRPPKPLRKKSWYYHSLSKDSAEVMLEKNHKQMDGNFLIRVDSMGIWYLSVYSERRISHIKIYKNENGHFMLENGQDELFASLEKLVQHFQNHLLILEGCGATFLEV